MKKQLLFFICTLIISVQMWTGNQMQAQSCPGLKNPMSFTDNYSGRVGGIRGEEPIGGMMYINGVIGWDTNSISAENLANIHVTPGAGIYGGIENIKQRGHVGGEFSNRFEIVDTGYDANTCYQLSTTPPDPSYTKSIRIGNSMNSELEELYYTMDVSEDNSLLIFWYAIVMEWPDPEHGEKNPKIQIEVLTENSYGAEDWSLSESCLFYEMLAGQEAVDQWKTIPCPPAGGNADQHVIYKDWAPVVINLKDKQGERVRIRFYNQDCLATGHYSYMYLAGECRPMRILTEACYQGGKDTISFLEAPAYLSNYQWYKGVYPNGVSIPESQGGKDSIIYILEDDFSTLDEPLISYYCTFDSYLDPENPCTDYISTFVLHTKPKIEIKSDVQDNRVVTFTNQSYLLSVDSKIDTTKTVWYIEDSTYYIHSQVEHQFSSEERHKVTLVVENIEGCKSQKNFFVLVGENEDVTIVPDSTSAAVTWEIVKGAEKYILTVYRDEEQTQVVCVLEFDSDGKLISTNFSKGTKINDFSYTIKDLLEGTNYYYAMVAYDGYEEIIVEQIGSFITLGETVDIKGVKATNVNIYPNPTANKLTIDNNQLPIGRVEIYDINGRKLSTINSSLSIFEVDMSHFAKGVYILKIGENKVKVIKE